MTDGFTRRWIKRFSFRLFGLHWSLEVSKPGPPIKYMGHRGETLDYDPGPGWVNMTPTVIEGLRIKK